MNRMIALFQRRADEALRNFTLTRSQIASLKEPVVGSVSETLVVYKSRLTELELKATRHSVELTIWQKAADLLRKEELNK